MARFFNWQLYLGTKIRALEIIGVGEVSQFLNPTREYI
jgi:hypothetical protein